MRRTICVVLVLVVLFSVLPLMVYATPYDYWYQAQPGADKKNTWTYWWWINGNPNMTWNSPDTTYDGWINSATACLADSVIQQAYMG